MTDTTAAALTDLNSSLTRVHDEFAAQKALNDSARISLTTQVNQKTEELERDIENFKNTAEQNIAATMDAKGGLVPWLTSSGKLDWYFGIPKFNIEEMRPDGSLGTGVHPAFIMNNGQEASMLWYSAYALSLSDGEVVSQPNAQPYTGRTQDEEIALCAASEIAGVGPKRVSSIWDESAITLMVEKMVQDGMAEPIGNTSYGKSHTGAAQRGHGASWTKTGTMGEAANHNRESGGIADFVGNVWTRCNGLHLQDGEIFLASNNDPLMVGNPVSTGYFYSSSNDSANGVPSIVDSASAVTRNGVVGSDAHENYDVIGGASGFASLTGASSALLRLAGLAPHGDGTDMSGAIWIRNYGRRAPLLRGSWHDGSSAGPRALALSHAPSRRSSNIGFRSAFVTGVS